jgi:ATP-dependent Lon protease
LIPKEVKAHGLKDDEWKITDAGLRDLIRYHTREAGVRNLEREIANLARKAVKEIVSHKAESIIITPDNVDTYAGVRKFRYGEMEGEDQVGVVTGLAWTEVGGDTLQIESVMLPGKGRMQTTGKLGDVMKESIDAARSYVRSKATTFGIKPPLFDKIDIHVHVPEGATPKDGPSAGVAMITSIVSVLTGIPVRREVAMTGEMTLRGRVLPIGGLKEKLLAALRAGVTTVLIPEENEKDLAEIPDNVKKGLKIIPVATADAVLAEALSRPLTPIEWIEPAETPAQVGEPPREGVVTH